MSEKRKRTGRDLQRQGIVTGVGGLVLLALGLAVGNMQAVILLGVVLALVGLVAWGAGLARGDN